MNRMDAMNPSEPDHFRAASPEASHPRPAFLITIDTEGDNLWSNPRVITTRNSRFLPRFQRLCERHHLKPTWLTNWEMAECPVYREFARDVLVRDTGEVGMHLHAWNNPPLVPLTSDDFACNPFLTQYPLSVMRDKVRAITEKLENVFATKMTSHRAGRWAFNEDYARLLVEHDYLVDCSVSPHVRWTQGYMPGEIDFRGFPETEYWLNPDSIAESSSSSSLLELPVTVLRQPRSRLTRAAAAAISRHRFGRRVAQRLWPDVRWLRPNGRNGRELIETIDLALADGRGYVEFMLHSSELMPGGSPRFATEAQIEHLYEDLDRLFEAAASRCVGRTLTEYAELAVARRRVPQAPLRAAG